MQLANVFKCNRAQFAILLMSECITITDYVKLFTIAIGIDIN
jgi:hypothetical protein